jgi:hypothetical protein
MTVSATFRFFGPKSNDGECPVPARGTFAAVSPACGWVAGQPQPLRKPDRPNTPGAAKIFIAGCPLARLRHGNGTPHRQKC